MKPSRISSLLASLLALAAGALAGTLRVEVAEGRSPDRWRETSDQAVRQFSRRAADLSTRSRALQARASRFPRRFFLPTTVWLTDRGRTLPFQGNREPGDLELVFATSGQRAFPTSYRNYLRRVFAAAKPAMDATFGQAAVRGQVLVSNFDADIQDRYAVAGGYYVPNGPDGREIRFPVYNDPVATAVNFIHTLLLAYRSPSSTVLDVYAEGQVRAATIRVARAPGSIPDAPTSEQVEAVLRGLYDVGEFYDWYNQPGLGSPRFIAANLLSTRLPPGGSTGGAFLLRYQMAGTAWYKILVEHPGFLVEFNRLLNAKPSAYRTVDELEALGQQALAAVVGNSGGTVEGVPYRQWALRQYIFDATTRAGLKVVAQPVPIVGDQGTADFGVFDIALHAFDVQPNGSEILLSGRSYPIFWRPDFSRFFGSAQDDVLELGGGYGSVTPNFTSDTFDNAPYRVTVDLPYHHRVARVNLPAGAYSTGQAPAPNTIYGTLSGVDLADTYVATVEWTGGQRQGIPIRNGAFGTAINEPGFLSPGRVTVRVFRVVGTRREEVLARVVAKSLGGLALDLAPAFERTYTLSRQAQLGMVGLPVQPYRPGPAEILGEPEKQTLFGRWSPILGRNELFPEFGEAVAGLGYWVRPGSAADRRVTGRLIPGQPVSVALQPGWNQVTVPFVESLPTSNILVTTATEGVQTFAEAVANGVIGPTVFSWQAAQGRPDEGDMAAVTRLSPGVGYFVRSDRPEGAVLVFFPPSGRVKPHGLETNRRPVWQWETEVVLTGDGDTSSVRLGQSLNATAGRDLGLDSELPPLRTLPRIAVSNGGLLYRDIRRAGDVTFRLRLDRLQPGREYSLTFRPIGGRKTLYVDTRRVQVKPGQTYRFRARGNRQVIPVVARAGR